MTFCYLHDFPSPLPRPYSHTAANRRRWRSRKLASYNSKLRIWRILTYQSPVELCSTSLWEWQDFISYKHMEVFTLFLIPPSTSVLGHIGVQEKLEGEDSYGHSKEVQSSYMPYGAYFLSPKKRQRDASNNLQGKRNKARRGDDRKCWRFGSFWKSDDLFPAFF